jgi:hypothetical protein
MSDYDLNDVYPSMAGMEGSRGALQRKKPQGSTEVYDSSAFKKVVAEADERRRLREDKARKISEAPGLYSQEEKTTSDDEEGESDLEDDEDFDSDEEVSADLDVGEDLDDYETLDDDAVKDALDKAEESMRAEWKGDYDKNIDLAKRALKTLGGDDLKKLLDKSGLGNNPAMIRMFFEAGKKIGAARFS